MTGGSPRSAGRGFPVGVLLVLGGLGVRLACCLSTVAPDRDASWYAWMARSFRDGRPQEALESVFPPLHPLLASLFGPFPGDPGAGWWHTLQAAGILWDLLGVLLLFDLLSRRGERRTAWFACSFWTFGMLPAWTVADGMSGPLFRFLLVLLLRGWILGPWWLTGLAAGLAAVTRPEALILLPLAAASSREEGRGPRPLRASVLLLLALGPRILYLLLRAGTTGKFLLFPKGALMAHLSASAEADLLRASLHWFHQAGRFLLQGFDGLGYLAFPLLPAGAWILLRRRRKPPLQGWALPFFLATGALLVVPFFFGNRRFWTPWLPILLPVTALPLARLSTARPGAALLLLVLSLLPHTARLFLPRRPTLAPLAALGPRLAKELRRGREESAPSDAPPWARAGLVSDLPRLYLFAGLRPPPPRSIPAKVLLEAARFPSVRFVAGLSRRKKLLPADLEGLGFHPARFGPPLDQALRREGFLVWKR